MPPHPIHLESIFYYSVPVCILLLIAWLSLVWIGREQICAAFQKIPFEKWIDSYGSDCFLLLLNLEAPAIETPARNNTINAAVAD